MNVTKTEIDNLERIDERFLRKIFAAPSTTPKVCLYLESGQLPLRFVLISRRLSFLKYILHEPEDSLIRRFFEAQVQNPIKNDRASQVKIDLEQINMNMTIDDVVTAPTYVFKKTLKEKVKVAAFKYLTEIKVTKSKAKDLSYDCLSLQKYLSSNNSMTIAEKQFVFNARSNMLDLKSNYKQGKSDLSCGACNTSEESQLHIMQCEALEDSCLRTQDMPDYCDLMGQDHTKIEAIGRILKKKFTQLKMKAKTNQCTGQVAMCSTSD